MIINAMILIDIDEQMREELREKKVKKGEKKKEKKRRKKEREILTRYGYGSILYRNTVYMEHHKTAETAAIGIQYTTKKKRGRGKVYRILQTWSIGPFHVRNPVGSPKSSTAGFQYFYSSQS